MTEQHPMIVAMAKAMAKAENDEGWSNTYVHSARAALTALLEPTPDMVEAGQVPTTVGKWRAMIQHVLANPQAAGQTTTATTKGER